MLKHHGGPRRLGGSETSNPIANEEVNFFCNQVCGSVDVHVDSMISFSPYQIESGLPGNKKKLPNRFRRIF